MSTKKQFNMQQKSNRRDAKEKKEKKKKRRKENSNLAASLMNREIPVSCLNVSAGFSPSRRKCSVISAKETKRSMDRQLNK